MRPLRCLLLILLGLALPVSGYAQSEDPCAAAYVEADRLYLEGQFQGATMQLEACLESNELTVEVYTRMYRLLALAYLYGEEPDAARLAVEQLLQQNAEYNADPVQDPPSYTSLVSLLRQERNREMPHPVNPVEEVAPEAVVAEGAQPQPGKPAPTELEEPIVTRPPAVPVDSEIQESLRLSAPKAWLLATGGVVVLISAAVLALGGTSTGPPG